MSEERFREVFRRLTSETPDPPAFSDLETHRAKPAPPIRLKPWMAAVGAAALVLVVVGAFGLLGGGGPDLAAPDENTIDYIKLEYTSTVNPVCEGGEIIDNGGFDEATIEVWGPTTDNLALMVATFPDGSTERVMVEGEPGNPDYIWVEGNPEDYPSNTKLRVVQCEGMVSPGLLDAFSPGSAGGIVPFHMLGPPPGFESFAAAFGPGQEPTPTEWNGNSVLLYEFRRDEEAGSNAIDLYVTEDDRRALRFHAEQSLPGVGDVVVDYSVVDQDEVPADSVSFSKTGLTAIAQVFGELGAEDCPVTIPSRAFVPPDTHPATPSDPDMVWFGKDELWTALSIDGISEERKSVWWSSEFTDPGIESSPDITVTYTLLNSATALTIVNDQGTNASTPEDGLFIIAGSEPDIEGCWQVTAIYKNASLSYIYYNPEGQDPESFDDVEPDAQLNPDFMTYSDELGRRWYATACPSADVLVIAGVDGTDGLPTEGQTWLERVENLIESNGTDFINRQGLTSIEPAVRNGEVWHEGVDGEIEVTRVNDYMIAATIGDTPCPGGPYSWNGIPVAFVNESGPGGLCPNSVPVLSPAQVLVFFHCGNGVDPNPIGFARPLHPGVDRITSTFQHLLAGPTTNERGRGSGSFFDMESKDALISAELTGTRLVLNFTEEILINNASTSNGSTFFLAELYANAFQFEDVGSVEFQINDSCEAFWEFLQAGPVCNFTDRAEWEQIQSQWENG